MSPRTRPRACSLATLGGSSLSTTTIVTAPRASATATTMPTSLPMAYQAGMLVPSMRLGRRLLPYRSERSDHEVQARHGGILDAGLTSRGRGACRRRAGRSPTLLRPHLPVRGESLAGQPVSDRRTIDDAGTLRNKGDRQAAGWRPGRPNRRRASGAVATARPMAWTRSTALSTSKTLAFARCPGA